MDQEKLNITVSFEGELAQYLKDIAEIDNKTVEEVLVSLAREALEEDIVMSKVADEYDIDGAEV